MGKASKAKKERRLREAQLQRARGVNEPLPPFGLPGQHQNIVMRPVFPEGDPRNDIPVDGALGRYRVVLTLARPGILPKPETEFSLDPDVPGDSHLAISPPAVERRPVGGQVTHIQFETTTDQGQLIFNGYPNGNGFLGRLVAELDASSLRDAQYKAHRAVAPTLSQISAQLDVPMHVWRIHTTFLPTRLQQITVINPFLATAPVFHDGEMSPEYRGLVSLYREALESTSPVYQFLCLYKIAEGIRLRRDRITAEAVQRGDQPPRWPSRRIPDTVAACVPWLNSIYGGNRQWDEMALDAILVTEARGKKINKLLDKEMTDLRVDIAHALSDATGNISMTADEMLHIERVNKSLPLMKCIVRRLLKDDFPTEFLPNVADQPEGHDPGAAGEPGEA